MNNPYRGEIWRVQLNPIVGAETGKKRPAVILSNDVSNRYAQTVTILPVTDPGERIFPFKVPLPAKTPGLTRESKVRCQQIRSVDKSRLLDRLGKVDSHKLREIEAALLVHLSIEQ